jgi:protein-tyrosine-phosphatase
MKISVVCHGNIAGSQILHHYLVEYAKRASFPLAVFSCGTAPREAYPDADKLLAEVRTELERRGIASHVEQLTATPLNDRR